MKKTLQITFVMLGVAFLCQSVNAGAVKKGVDGTKKGVNTAVGGTEKGAKVAVGGTEKGAKTAIGGTKKGFKETGKMFKKVL